MAFLQQLTERAAADPRHIVLAEGGDERVVKAAVRAANDRIAQISIVGDRETVRQLAGGDVPGSDLQIIDPADFVGISDFAEMYRASLKRGNIAGETAIRAARKPLNFAHLMVQAGDADGALAGAVHSSAQVIRSAAQIIGPDPAHDMVSSFFLMIMDQPFHDRPGVIAFADCALVEDPDAEQLAQIAAATADSVSQLLGTDPKVALLSYATGDSASPPVRMVNEARRLLAETRPDIPAAGPIQFDTAFLPEVAAIKAPDTPVAGKANIFIFPDLNSGNIGYKICERLGKARALGPVLQGFAEPVNDLSRGCSEDDIYAMIAMTVLQAQAV